jgi:predicted O-methyltransferase YrrM
MNLLVKEAGARSVLEVGTSYGYSTVWLAEAARETGGKLVTLEIHPAKAQYATVKLAQAGSAALAPGAAIVADNMLYPKVSLAAAGKYRRHVRATAGMSSVLAPVGSGIEISRFRADP